jgi:hypothetical protein
MPRIRAISCTKNDRMNATMPMVLPGIAGDMGAP